MKENFRLKDSDIGYLFVMGFGFLISCFNLNMGIGYFGFIFIGSIYLGFLNGLGNKKNG
jgi:hypothetical protein